MRHDARDGRVRMSLDLDAEHYAVGLYAGEGQLLVALAEESGHTFQFRSVMGVDPDTGEVRWRKFDGDPFVVGGHLVVRTDDGITVYR